MERRKTDSPDPESKSGIKTATEESVIFLGRAMSRDEYELACRNLREFFDLLKSWQEGDTNEPSEL